MSDYLITFTGYIDERKRPENFPRTIKEMIFVSADTNEQVVKAVNDYSLQYIRAQGMSVRNDPTSMEDSTILDTSRRWVPMHMLTHFDAKVKQITGKIPMFDKEGRIELDDDDKPVRN